MRSSVVHRQAIHIEKQHGIFNLIASDMRAIYRFVRRVISKSHMPKMGMQARGHNALTLHVDHSAVQRRGNSNGFL